MKIFVSYSHQNWDWVDENGKYKLIPWLKRQLNRENVSFWTDHALKELVGEEYKRNIKSNIDDSDIALLLVSQDFASSDFILDLELPWIREKYESNKIKIVPLLIDDLSQVGRSKIPWIFELQTIPNDTKPIIDYVGKEAEWSKVKNNILDALFRKIDDIRKQQSRNSVNETPPTTIKEPTLPDSGTETTNNDEIEDNSKPATNANPVLDIGKGDAPEWLIEQLNNLLNK